MIAFKEDLPFTKASRCSGIRGIVHRASSGAKKWRDREFWTWPTSIKREHSVAGRVAEVQQHRIYFTLICTKMQVLLTDAGEVK